MRLIDAEDLYSRFEDEYKVSYKKAMATLSDYWRGIHDGIDWGCLRIIKAPAIEAEPLRHGKWLPTNDENKKQCSRCEVIHLIAQYPNGDKNYCPNCGAKMDGGGEE